MASTTTTSSSSVGHTAVIGSASTWLPIRRALLSVYDKSGLVELAQQLDAHGVQLLSTGGTANALRAAGLKVTDVSEVTGSPEMLHGRVKTLHPLVHGGLLAVRGNPDDEQDIVKHSIPLIDMVVVNLYPFRQVVAQPGVSLEQAVENIDIGGPSMIRSASKNHKYVTVVTAPSQYSSIRQELSENSGKISYSTRYQLAAQAFATTAQYDTAIAEYLAHEGKKMHHNE